MVVNAPTVIQATTSAETKVDVFEALSLVSELVALMMRTGCETLE